MKEHATFAGGCFWCTEAIFKRLHGVSSAIPGYAGGDIPNPTYEAVCNGDTGYAEAIDITYDPTKISYETLVEIFWHLHDPTILNRQGNDIGTQYRSAIFYRDEKQKETALRVKEKIQEQKLYSIPIVTEITQFTTFYPAEEYHQNYYEQNRDAPYCAIVVSPKVEKLLIMYKEKIKDEYK